MLRIKRVYEEAEPDDGVRILVDRLWPRGLSREKARVDRWEKELAPSDELRRWFGHDPGRWEEFSERYRHELAVHRDLIEQIALLAENQTVTLIFAARDRDRNNAVVLRELLEERGRN